MLFFVWLRMQSDPVQQDLTTFMFFTLESKIVSLLFTEKWGGNTTFGSIYLSTMQIVNLSLIRISASHSSQF